LTAICFGEFPIKIIKLNMKVFFAVLLSFCLLSCNESKKVNADIRGRINYELVKWPQLPEGFSLGQVNGIGIDTNQNVFLFHRAERRWKTLNEVFPDTPISANTILLFDNESGKLLKSWGANLFIMPHGLTVDKENNVWVTDVGLQQIFKFTHDGKLLMTLGVAKVAGNDSLHFNYPTDIAVANDGSFYVSDGYRNSRVVKFSKEGKYLFEWGKKGDKPGEFNIPHSLAIDENNIIYVADRQNNRVQLFDTAGNFIKELKNDVNVEQLPAVSIDNANHLFAVDYDPTKGADSLVKGSSIFEIDSSSHCKGRFGANASTDRTSCWFHDIAFDKKGNIYVGDIKGLKVLKYKPKK